MAHRQVRCVAVAWMVFSLRLPLLVSWLLSYPHTGTSSVVPGMIDTVLQECRCDSEFCANGIVCRPGPCVSGMACSELVLHWPSINTMGLLICTLPWSGRG
jgi:hypothetical protein